MIQTLDQSPASPDVLREDAGRQSPPAKAPRTAWLQTLLFGAVAAGLLCWIGFYNGYPILTADSGSYLYSGAFGRAVWPYRAPGYGAFMKWTRLRTSSWLTIAAQAILVVYILRETLAHLIGGERSYIDRCLLYGACLLAVLTGLPWLVSELMPDVFAGVLLLAAFLLAFAGELGLKQQIALTLLLTVSVASHTSLLPITVLYVAVLVGLRLADRGSFCLPPLPSVLVWLLVPVIAAGFYTAMQNRKMGLGFSLSPTKNYFLLGRLFGNGMARDYLRENCPEHPFLSCQYLSNLPRDEANFLFEHPLMPVLRAHPDEVSTIAHAAILADPQRFLVSSAQQTLHQLVSLRTGGDTRLHPLTDVNFHFILMVIPKEFQPFFISKQFSDGLAPLTDTLASVHTAVFWLSLVGCALFAWAGRYAQINKLFAAAVGFLVINAAVCASLSGAYDRYQSRVAWVVPFCLLAYVCSALRERKGGAARGDPIHPFHP